MPLAAEVEQAKQRWTSLAAELPHTKDDPARALRSQLFFKIDGNGNGFINLTELRLGLVRALGEDGAAAVDEVVATAFDQAKDARASRNEQGAQFVEKSEFRLFLIYVKRWLLARLFEVQEAGSDGRLDQQEFTALLGLLTTGWGISVADPVQSFQRLDEHETTVISLATFVQWATAKGIQVDDVTTEDGPPPSELEKKMSAAFTSSRLDDHGGMSKLTAALDLGDLVKKLPCSKDPADLDVRSRLFEIFDANHNGMLSLGEVDLGLRIVLRSNQDVQALAPAIVRAFHAAKDAKKGKPGCSKADTAVGRDEFRLLLVYLKRYGELLQMYDAIDTSNDRRLDEAEFSASLPRLLEWGVPVADPKAEFQAMSGGGTSVLFDDFCAWALARGLDMDSADDVEGELTLRSQHKSSAEVAGSLATETAARMREIEERINAQDMQANARDRTAGLDMKSLHETLPTTGDEEHIERRARLFKRMDVNGNGVLSLTEVDLGLRELLDAQMSAQQISDRRVSDALSPAITRAFHAAKDSKHSLSGEDAAARARSVETVSKDEFKLLVVALKRYVELLLLFDQVDLSDDRRLDFDEFCKALPLLDGWGMAVADPRAEFTSIDTNGGGFLMFDE